MVRLVVCIAVLVLLAGGPLTVLAEGIKTVAGQPVESLFESAIPEPDQETMQEIDRLLDQVLEGQKVLAPEGAGSTQDNQGDKADGRQGE